MILKALSKAGGWRYLQQQAKENPVAFMTLVGKVLPLQVTGADGGPILTRVIHEDWIDGHELEALPTEPYQPGLPPAIDIEPVKEPEPSDG